MFGSKISKFVSIGPYVSKSLLSGSHGRALFAISIAVLTVIGLTIESQNKVAASGNLSGTVFIDYNMNGVRNVSGALPNLAVDKGIAGVTVTAYDPAGTPRGSDVSDATGAYLISAAGTGPYRIEFTGLPSGYMPSAAGTDNESAVRFVSDGNSTGNDFGVISAKEYCQNNPELATTCFSGTVNGNSADPVLISFPYVSGTTSTTSSAGVDSPSTHTLAVPQNQFGSVWGLSYHRQEEQVFAAAFTKRHAGFRSGNADATGEIFISNKTGSSAGLFLNLNTLFGSNVAGSNPHDTGDYETDAGAFDAVGKNSFGDIDISDDGQTLYVVNLADRNLYAIPLGSGFPTAPTLSSQVTVYDLASLMNPGTAANDGCPMDSGTPGGEMNLNLRPGGLKFKDDRLFVGLTCTAQSTNSISDLRAYVYELNPAGSGSAVQVVNFALDYPRGCVSDNGTTCSAAEWQPWTNNVSAIFTYTPWDQRYYPQPWLLDIEFDQNEFMMLGMSDRLGHQTGNAASGADTGTVEGVSAGETLRMYKTGATWTLEDDADDGTNPPTAGAGTSEGPGGGEFYYQDGYTVASDTHSEISLGGLLNVPGFQDIVVSAFDPAPTGSLPNSDPTYRAGGVVWLSNTDGTRSRSYQLFGIDAVNTFGKASGIGDLEAMCDMAPLEIGNRVWNDADGDGIQDPNESVFQNVVLELWADTTANGSVDTQVGTATTDSAGNYVFGGTSDINLTSYSILPATAYEIRVLASNFNSGQPLENYHPTTPDADGSGNGDARDSDGIVFPGDVVTAQFTTGGNAGDNDHSFDFGFRPEAGGQPNHSIGNRVWYDTDNDGVIDPAEVGISGISVSLFLDSGGDGVPDTPGSPVGTVSTDADGYYRFDSLAAETYLVRINPTNFGVAAKLERYQNTSGNNVADMESYGAGSSAENGINPTAAADMLTDGILSNPITVAANLEPTSEADVPSAGLFSGQGAFDGFADMTVDFGFYCLSLSGTVWNDAGAGPDTDDGELDSGEALLSGYTVRLYDAANTEIPVGPDGKLGTADDGPGGVVTNGTGDYAFDCLPQGDYRVVVQSNGADSSGPTENDPDDNGDDNDNGIPQTSGPFTGQVASGVFTLTPGDTGTMGNNTINNGEGSTSNPTVDFGLLLSPTQVKLDRFEAFHKGNDVVIEWNTGGESGNLGFNVYRSTMGGRELLNAAPVAGSSLLSGAALRINANVYRWIDRGVEPGSSYYIEDIDLNGSITTHGPIWPKFSYSFNVNEPQSPMLTGLESGTHRPVQLELLKENTGTAIRAASSRIDAQRVIASQKGVKVVVGADDRFKVSFDQLAASGFDTASSSENWQVFVDGEQIPVRITANDLGLPEIEILGRASDSRYSGKSVYYIVSGESPGIRVEQYNDSGNSDAAVAESFRVTAVRKERSLYVSSVLNGENENWFGPPILGGSDTVREIVVTDPDLIDNREARLRIKLQGLTSGAHLVNVGFNGTQLGTVSYAGTENREFDFEVPMSSLVNGSNSVSLRSIGSGSDISLIEETSIRYSRKYIARDGRLRFAVSKGLSAKVTGFDSAIDVYELDGDGKVVRMFEVPAGKSAGTYGFRISASDEDREFAAYRKSHRSSHNFEIAENIPSILHHTANNADLVVIGPRIFAKQGERIQALKKLQGLESVFVDIDDIYDEYSYGRKSDLAIREFLFDSQSWDDAPGYVILLGDSSYDMRNYLNQSDRDIVPTHFIDTRSMETASDSWFADFDDDGIEDIAIGRLPAGTYDEAAGLVDKLERYQSQSDRSVRTSVMVADSTFEGYSDSLESLLPDDVEARKLNRSVLSDGNLNTALIDAVNQDAMTVTYTGHGAMHFWAGANVFSVDDAASLTNGKLSFFMMMTCLTGITHNLSIDSLSEAVVKAENGAIAVWASSGTTYAPDQFMLSGSITGKLFDGNTRIGDLTREAKLETADMDVRRTWQLIGDPTLVIK